MHVYQTENGYQIDAAHVSLTVAPSRFRAGGVEVLEVYPADYPREKQAEVIAAARRHGLPL